MKWQNERYVRSAENQDDIGDLKTTINDLERRISNWRKNDITRVNGKPYGMG